MATDTVTDRVTDRVTAMRHRGLGALFLASGLSFLAAVLNPPILPYWGDDTGSALQLAAAHRAAWFATVWLLTVAIAAAAGAVKLTSNLLDTPSAALGNTLYLIGATLGIASTTFDLAVTSSQLDAGNVPDWYVGAAQWADGLSTAYFAVLSPVALILLAVAVLRSRVLPHWTAVALIAAAACLLGQYAAWGGALPFPQFLAFVAIGARLMVRPAVARTRSALPQAEIPVPAE
jgi:hypothetical protein